MRSPIMAALTLVFRDAIPAVLKQAWPAHSIDGDAIAQVDQELQLLMDVVVAETLQCSTATLVSKAAVEKVVKFGLMTELSGQALAKMKAARDGTGHNSGLVFPIGAVKMQLRPQLGAGQRVEKGVCASLAALLESVCSAVLQLAVNRCDSLITSPDLNAAVCSVLGGPTLIGKVLLLPSGVDGREAEASARKAADGGFDVPLRRHGELARAWLHRLAFKTVYSLLPRLLTLQSALPHP